MVRPAWFLCSQLIATMAMGRIPDIALAPAALKDALSPHIVVVTLRGLVPYTQLRMRRRGDWEGCFRNRSIITDILVATKGHTLSQPYLMAGIKAVVAPLCQDGNPEPYMD